MRVPDAVASIRQRRDEFRQQAGETTEFGSGAPRGSGIAAMKCQSYQHRQYRLHSHMVHGLIHDAR